MNPNLKKRIESINKGIIPEGYKKTKVGIVPVEWEVEYIGNICKIQTGKSNTQDAEENGLYPFFVRSPIVYKSNRYLFDCETVITVGDGVGTGKVFHYYNGKFDLHQRNYAMTDFNGVLGRYFYYFFSYYFYKRVMSMTAKTSVDSVRYEMIDKMSMFLPPLAEQQKIAEILSTQDKLIELHEKKVEKLKELKKAYLQKMFPQKGSKYPEIRFKGFTDPWEQRKFSDCYKMSSGYAFKMSDYCEDGVGLINGESIQHGIINDDNLNHLPESFIKQYSDFILKDGDIVIGLNRPITNGNLKIARIPSKYNDSLLYQRAGKIVYKEEYDKDFTYVLLSQEILKHTLVEAVGSDQPFISTSKLDKWQMMIPMNLEEQHKIGQFFSELDTTINLHQRKSEQEKQKKKALMQLLLTGKVRCI